MRALLSIGTLVALSFMCISPNGALAANKGHWNSRRRLAKQGEPACATPHETFPQGPSLYAFLKMAKAPLGPSSGHSLASLPGVGQANRIETALSDSGLFVLTSVDHASASTSAKSSVRAVGALPKGSNPGPSTHLLHVSVVPGKQTGYLLAHWADLTGKTPRNHLLLADARGNLVAIGPEGKPHRNNPDILLPAFIAISNHKTLGVIRSSIMDSGELGGWVGGSRSRGAAEGQGPPVVPLTDFPSVAIAPFGADAVEPTNYCRSIVQWAELNL